MLSRLLLQIQSKHPQGRGTPIFDELEKYLREEFNYLKEELNYLKEDISYRCNICDERFWIISERFGHITGDHRKIYEGLRKCFIGLHILTNRSTLKEHFKKMHQISTFHSM